MSFKNGKSTTNEALGYQGWKQLKDAGIRWIAEIVFSSIKRVLGEDLLSKFSTQKVEAGLKVMLYNKFMSIKPIEYADSYKRINISPELSYILQPIKSLYNPYILSIFPVLG